MEGVKKGRSFSEAVREEADEDVVDVGFPTFGWPRWAFSLSCNRWRNSLKVTKYL